MNLDQVKYSVKFGNLPEGKLFILKSKELQLNPEDLGKFFTCKDNFFQEEDLENYSFQLYGLSFKASSTDINNLKDDPRFPYLKYCNHFFPIFYILFKIYYKGNETSKEFSCSIETFKNSFEKIEE